MCNHDNFTLLCIHIYNFLLYWFNAGSQHSASAASSGSSGASSSSESAKQHNTHVHKQDITNKDADELSKVLQSMKHMATDINLEQDAQLKQIDKLTDSVDRAKTRLTTTSRRVDDACWTSVLVRRSNLGCSWCVM